MENLNFSVKLPCFFCLHMVKYSYVDFLERLLKITMTIGEKIKFLRLSKKLTQSAICGDLITRNMLSRIENGAALPSLPTLKQLADALGVSAGYFLDAGDDPFPYQKLALMPPIKEAFKKGDYTSALALSASLDKDDEIAYIEAASFFALGYEAYRKGRLMTAEKLLLSSQEAAKSSLYAEDTLVKKNDYYLSLIRRTKENKLHEVTLDEGDRFAEEIEYYLYLYMLHITKTTRYDIAAAIYDTMRFQSTLFRKHINARLSLLARNNSRAATLLEELAEEMQTSDCDPVFALNVLTDRESLAGALGDYEAAYRALLQKNALLEAFQK